MTLMSAVYLAEKEFGENSHQTLRVLGKLAKVLFGQWVTAQVKNGASFQESYRGPICDRIERLYTMRMEKAYEQWATTQQAPVQLPSREEIVNLGSWVLIAQLTEREMVFRLYEGCIKKVAASATAPEADKLNLGILSMLMADMYFYSYRQALAENYYRYAKVLLPKDNENVPRIRRTIFENWPQEW